MSSDLARLTHMCEQNTQSISDLKEDMISLESKCDSYATDIQNINEKLVGMEIQVETLENKNSTPELNNSIKQINYLHTIMINQAKSLKKGQVKQEAYNQRSNFIFSGVPEKRGEDCVREIDRIIYQHMGLRNAWEQIDKSRRLEKIPPRSYATHHREIQNSQRYGDNF